MDKGNLQILLPLIGVAVGWLLNEMGYVFRARRENKKALGKALKKLLEIRAAVRHHQDLFHAAQNFNESGELSEKDMAMFRALEAEFNVLPEDTLEPILIEVATVDPILSYSLGKDVRGISMLKRTFEHSLSFKLRIVGDIHKALIDSLDEAIFKVSKRKSLLLWWRIRKQLRVMDEGLFWFGDSLKRLRETAGAKNMNDLEKFFDRIASMENREFMKKAKTKDG